MELIPIVAGIFVLVKVTLIVIAIAFFISGLDDLFVDIVHTVRSLYRRFWVMRRYQPLSLEELLEREEQWLAVIVPAWDESAVIGQMLNNLLTTANYNRFFVFVGTYPNDPDTQKAVQKVREAFENVELVVCPNQGPTNKADCLNWVYQAILNFEERKAVRFEVFVMQDAEDIVHPLSFRLFNYLIPSKKDMVQIPVIPLETGWSDFVGGHYLDEFAESHFKDLQVRELLSGVLPSAGVGCALGRKGIQDVCAANRNQLFAVNTLTEDYELGFRLSSVGAGRHAFVRKAFERDVVETGFFSDRPVHRTVNEYISTREYFPRTLSAAVRQKSRWVYGIAIQGWKHLRWGNGFWTSYMLYRDRKGLITNQVNLLGYLVLSFGLGYWVFQAVFPGFYRFPPLVERGTWLWNLILVDTGFMGVRLFQRAFAVKLIYGWGQALLSIPRQVFLNVINFLATARALGLLAQRLMLNREVVWEKTAHMFPSRVELQHFHRRLGELLLERRQIKVKDLERILALQEEKRRPLGTLLLEQNLISEEALVTALGGQLGMGTGELNLYQVSPEIIRRMPRSVAIRYSVFPVGFSEGGSLVLASDRKLSANETEEIRLQLGCSVEFVLVPRSDLAFAIRRGCDSRYGPAPARLGPALCKRGVLSPETAERLGRAQRRTYQRIGDLLCELWATTDAELQQAVKDYRPDQDGRFGQFLVRSGLVSDSQLELALATQRHRFRTFGELLEAEGLADSELVRTVAAERRGWARFITEVRQLPRGQVWMWDPDSAFPRFNGKIDQDDLLELASANTDRKGFINFDAAVLNESVGVGVNSDTLRQAGVLGLTANIIVQDLRVADSVTDQGLLPVLVHNGHRETIWDRTPAGREVLNCPRFLKQGTECLSCALCARTDRRFVLRLPKNPGRRDVVLLAPQVERFPVGRHQPARSSFEFLGV